MIRGFKGGGESSRTMWYEDGRGKAGMEEHEQSLRLRDDAEKQEERQTKVLWKWYRETYYFIC